VSRPKEQPAPPAWLPLTPEQQALLAERVRQGDKSAEEELVWRFERPILALLIARTRDAESSRDLTQEVLLASLLALRQGRLREPDRLAAFVASTARNLAFKHLRSRRRAPLQLEETAEAPSPRPTPDAWFEAAERTDLVADALQSLDEPERAVLELTWRENLSPRQIARTLGLSSDVVRTRKSRALRKVIEWVRLRTRSPLAKDSLEGKRD